MDHRTVRLLCPPYSHTCSCWSRLPTTQTVRNRLRLRYGYRNDVSDALQRTRYLLYKLHTSFCPVQSEQSELILRHLESYFRPGYCKSRSESWLCTYDRRQSLIGKILCQFWWAAIEHSPANLQQCHPSCSIVCNNTAIEQFQCNFPKQKHRNSHSQYPKWVGTAQYRRYDWYTEQQLRKCRTKKPTCCTQPTNREPPGRKYVDDHIVSWDRRYLDSAHNGSQKCSRNEKNIGGKSGIASNQNVRYPKFKLILDRKNARTAVIEQPDTVFGQTAAKLHPICISYKLTIIISWVTAVSYRWEPSSDSTSEIFLSSFCNSPSNTLECRLYWTIPFWSDRFPITY